MTVPSCRINSVHVWPSSILYTHLGASTISSRETTLIWLGACRRLRAAATPIAVASSWCARIRNLMVEQGEPTLCRRLASHVSFIRHLRIIETLSLCRPGLHLLLDFGEVLLRHQSSLAQVRA